MEQNDISVLIKTNADEAYDRLSKKFISIRAILVQILKICTIEFNDITLSDISSYIHERYLDSNGKNILSGNTEDETILGAKIIYDVLFEARVPGKEDETIIVNVELQGTDQKSYVLLRRAIYYAVRLLDRQKNSSEGFQNSEFNKLKKVYSIWICMNHTNEKNNTIKYYTITEKGNGKYKSPKEDYDLMSVVMIYVNKKYDYDEDDRSLDRLLHIILGKDLNAQQKKEYLEKDYGILISEEEEKEVEEMCDLSLGLRMEAMQEGLVKGKLEGLAEGKIEGKLEGIAEGKIEGRLESTILHVKNLMKKIPNISMQEAMDILEIEENLRDQVEEALQ